MVDHCPAKILRLSFIQVHVYGSLTSNSITFSNLVGGKLPPSLDREDTELLPFLLLLDLPEEPCRGFFHQLSFFYAFLEVGEDHCFEVAGNKSRKTHLEV